MGKRTGRPWGRAVAMAAWVLVGMGAMQNGCGTESAQVSPGSPTSRDAQSSGRETLAQLDSQRQEALEKEKNPSIHLFTDPKTAGKGLLVTCTKNVIATGPQAGVVDIAVTNLLEEEVFLAVTGMDTVGCSLEIKEAGHGAACGYYYMSSAGLLKRLEACHYLDGKVMPCGCVIAQIKSRLPEDLKLKEWIGARGKVTLFLNGFYRNSGKAFSESIDLPIEIVNK